MTKEWFSPADLAGLAGMPASESGVIRKAKREEWRWQRRKIRGGGRTYHLSSLPVETQAACLVSAIPTEAPAPVKGPFVYDRDNLWSAYARKSNAQKETAKAKLILLDAVMRLHQNGTAVAEAIKAVAGIHGKSWRTIQGWYLGTPGKPGVKHYDRCDWLAALVPGYTGGTHQAELSQEAWDFFRADYLRLEAPAAAACYDRLKRAAAAHGWEVPALRTIDRRIKEIPRTIRVLRREGEQGLMRLYPTQQRTVRELHALQWINGDGYQHNVFVKFPNGDIERAKTWFWQCVYSRKIVGYRVDLTENTDSIRLSFGDVVDTFGIPEHATIDNTRSAANKWMTGGVRNRYRFKVKEDDPLGLFPTLGVQVHWTSVNNGRGHGQAKPVERAFGIGGIGEVVDKHPAFAGAYTGNNTNAKPENYGSTAIPVEQFLAILQEEITAWNERTGRRTEICGGVLSFNQAFNASYENAPIRKATAEQRRLWLLSAEAIPVRNDGSLTLDAGSATGKGRNRYSAHELLEYSGHKVVVRFDPEDLHGSVYAYTLDGRYICAADCIEATGFGNTDAARAFNRERKKFIRATKVAAKAETRMDTIEVANRLPQTVPTDIPNPKVVRPLRAAPKLGRPVPQPTISAQQAAEIEKFQANYTKPALVVNAGDNAIDRYERWCNLNSRLLNGQRISDVDQRFWAQYQKGVEFSSLKGIYDDFEDSGLRSGA